MVKKKENFQTATSLTALSDFPQLFNNLFESQYSFKNYIIFMTIFAVLSFIVISAGVLSWNYNMFIGTPKWLAGFYALLAILFPHFYFTFYALFLNPVSNTGMIVAPNAAGGNAYNTRRMVSATTPSPYIRR